MPTRRPAISETVRLGFGFDEPCVKAKVTRLDGRYLEIALDQEVKPGEAARILCLGAIALGEVCECRVSQNGYLAMIAVEQVLYDADVEQIQCLWQGLTLRGTIS